ncbi:DegT/DnrJ/EryC1/StrS aminotransferase family protein [Massilia sp. ZL223]|nr:DegT/DnrJ/EryC1/StrS aminotransferase family protein [Massilia sp. ZL223]
MLAAMRSNRPAIPLAPVLSLASFRRDGGARALTVLDAGAARLVTSGRVAIALALRELGVGAGDSVLLPAYHSASMVPPVLWRGALPLFYRVGPDGQADLDDIAARIAPHTRVLVATHFFGFPQPLAALRALCDARGIALLEDCAHAFIGEHEGRPLGSWGDYAAASIMKFLPLYEGGALVSARRDLSALRLLPAGPGFELKAAFNTLERGFSFGRLGALRAALWLPLRAKDLAWRALKRSRPPRAQLAPASSDSGYGFDPAWADKRASRCTRLILALSSPARVAARRREHYLRLQQALQGLPGVRPLHASLPEGVCPWLFPLVAEDPDGLARRLLADGVPLTRFGYPLWEGMDPAACTHAAYLSRHVLGLPCHQELDDSEATWLADALRRAALA